jgi:DnaA family protein
MRQLALALEARPAPTFANFVAGRNAAALAAIRALAAAPEGVIYVWGEPGCGRSHLLEAAVAAARLHGAHATLVTGTPRDWTATADARLVAVDDIDRLATADQVLLFDLWNELRVRGGALLAAGPTAPGALAVRDDLRTRLAAGLAFQLHPLSDAEKSHALADYARQRGLRVAADVVPYLLAHLRRDMATQIAVVDALDRYSLEQKRPVTLPLVREALASLASEGLGVRSQE